MTDQIDMIYLKIFLYFGLAYSDCWFCYSFYSYLLAQNNGAI